MRNLMDEALPGATPLLQWPEDLMDVVRLLRAEPVRLKMLRVALGLSQIEIAKKFSVTSRTWGGWERGTWPIPGRQALRIAKELKNVL